MDNLKGKKLLVISSEKKDLSFVNAAREMGAYIICCDIYTDYNISMAKKYADEAWDIDYNKVDLIAEKCREKGVDGVIAGYGEDRVMAAAKIANLIGTPFYATEEQINFTRNKILFEKACRECGVMIPNWYKENTDPADIKFPVIVKPSDSCGRKGISICNNPEELKEAIIIAKSISKNGEIIIEEYIKGIELLSIYTIKDGEYSLSCLNDKYNSEDPDGPTLCDLVISPSSFLQRYKKDVDPGIKRLLKYMGAQNGVANFQFIANEKGIYAFEMGYRVNGNDDWKTIARHNGINFVKMLINHSITGDMGDDLSKDNPAFPDYNVTLCGYLKPGKIGKIETGDIDKIENIYDIFFTKSEGSNIPEAHNNARKTFLVKFTSGSLPETIEVIKKIQNNIKIFDTEGNPMLLKKFDVKRLEKN